MSLQKQIAELIAQHSAESLLLAIKVALEGQEQTKEEDSTIGEEARDIIIRKHSMDFPAEIGDKIVDIIDYVINQRVCRQMIRS